MRQPTRIERPASLTERGKGPVEVDGVPENNGRDDQVQAAGPIALRVKCAIAQFTQAVKAHGARQRVFQFALVETDVAPATQLGVLQPLERKERPFQLGRGNTNGMFMRYCGQGNHRRTVSPNRAV